MEVPSIEDELSAKRGLLNYGAPQDGCDEKEGLTNGTETNVHRLDDCNDESRASSDCDPLSDDNSSPRASSPAALETSEPINLDDFDGSTALDYVYHINVQTPR